MTSIARVTIEVHDPDIDVTAHSVDWTATFVAEDGDGHETDRKTVMLDAITAQDVTESLEAALTAFVGPGHSFDARQLPDYDEGEAGSTVYMR